MKKITSTEFQKNVGRYSDIALNEPVTITKHGRPTWVIISYALYEKLKGKKNNGER